jgi:hypothetical protein
MRLKYKLEPWTYETTKAIQTIQQKIQNLTTLSLPKLDLPFILETDASNVIWAAILQKHVHREEACMYSFSCFKELELKYPSSYKEILAVKNDIKLFMLLLKPVHFIVHTDLKHM